MIEQLANAQFLLKAHNDDSLPIFAGAMIECCKAIETAVNEVIVCPFANTWPPVSSRAEVEITTPSGRPRVIELAFRGQPKSLMLGDLVLLLKCGRPEWDNYCRRQFGQLAEWIRDDLPRIIKTVKDEYRNGAAHDSSANRGKVLALKQYLDNSKVFASFNKLSKSR